jgi:hypothetical protein
MPKSPTLFPEEESYITFLSDLKTRIRQAQVKAALAVNKELVLLYWQIGRDILQRQQEEGWGSKVITRLAKDSDVASSPTPKDFQLVILNICEHLLRLIPMSK